MDTDEGLPKSSQESKALQQTSTQKCGKAKKELAADRTMCDKFSDCCSGASRARSNNSPDKAEVMSTSVSASAPPCTSKRADDMSVKKTLCFLKAEQHIHRLCSSDGWR